MPDLNKNPLLQSLGKKPRRGRIIVCGICRKKVYAKPSEKKKKYCSMKCQGIAKRKKKKILKCKQCKKPFKALPSYLKLRYRVFCSEKCKHGHMRVSRRGRNNPAWKGGVSKESVNLRTSSEWREWREKVFERDKYTCQDCGKRSGNGKAVTLHPHHIKQFAFYPELRFEVSNGRTLCTECHKKIKHLKREEYEKAA